MTYFSDLHTYLHQSSLLIQAYPTTRITTKYSLPRKPNPKAKSSKKTKEAAPAANGENADSTAASSGQQPKRDPSATLTLKTYHPESGICLKYRTDKAAEVGRLMTGLGRLAKGELIEMPTPTAATAGAVDGTDKMEVDAGVSAPKLEETVVTSTPAAVQTVAGGGGGAATGSGGGGKGKKKKGKK